MPEESSKLLELARKKFAPRQFSIAEEKLFRRTEIGEPASALTGDEKQDDPANAASWQADRVAEAVCIAWLCTDRDASMLVTHRGVQLEGMRIDGDLNLDGADVKFPLWIWKCAFSASILFQNAQLRILSLEACHIKDLRAYGVKVAGAVYLRNGKIEGEVSLAGSKIEGDLSCVGAQLLNPKGIALSADGVEIKGGAYLRGGFKAEGGVRLLGATIGGSLECDGAQFSNSNGPALNADRVEIKGGAFLRNGFKAEGEVRLLGATIGGTLGCDGAQFSNSNGPALSADRVEIKGSAFLRNGFKAQGEVRLLGATIGGDLGCDGAQFSNSNGPALSADGIEIKGSAFLRNGFKAEGEVRLLGATIGGTLECDGAQFSNSNGGAFSAAFFADRVEIKGGAFLRNGFKAEGEVRLRAATIAFLQIREVLGAENIRLDLRSAHVGTFWDDEQSWPSAGNLFLDGFHYERLYAEAPLDAKSRKKWLHRQPSDKFLPQPYEHLAAVLREMGHERDARLVMMAKNRERTRFTRFPRQGWWWYNLFGRIIGYGYAPGRAFAMSVAMIVLGAFLFGAGFSHHLISPTKEGAYEKNSNEQFALLNNKRRFADDYPVFNAFVYSLESFTPLLKLDQSANWTPNANHGAHVRLWYWQLTTGGLLRWYLWFHIIAGWVLTTLWVGAVTGLVKS